jgi:hypothetical protein
MRIRVIQENSSLDALATAFWDGCDGGTLYYRCAPYCSVLFLLPSRASGVTPRAQASLRTVAR